MKKPIATSQRSVLLDGVLCMKDILLLLFEKIISFVYTNAMSTNELQITDIEVGTGKEAVKGALIVVQYEGFLSDGTKFDSSYDRGRPFQCVIGTGRVIKGWDMGMMGMKVGGKRELFVPSHLAYGERQIGALIKPHSDLKFTVELLEVHTRDE